MRGLLLAAEAVDEAHLEAGVVLERSAEGRRGVAGSDAEGEVGVEWAIGSEGAK